MPVQTVGVLSPGEMGAAVGRELATSGLEVVTCLAGRSVQTRERAAAAGMVDVANLQDVIRRSDLVLSILVPAEASGLARAVGEAMRATGDTPPFADCNAIAPATVVELAGTIEAAGAACIDAGIIGGPPRPDAAPRFYASGAAAETLAELDGRGIDVIVVGDGVGRASAIKMCYAALTKGSSALQMALLIAAERLGVYAELTDELRRSQTVAYDRSIAAAPRLPRVAHRWIGEMEEIAATFASVDVTPDFHRGAAAVYRLIAEQATTLPAESGERHLRAGVERLSAHVNGDGDST